MSDSAITKSAKILVVSDDPRIIAGLNEKKWIFPLRSEIASSSFEAGITIETFHPDCVIVDFTIGRSESLIICHGIRRKSEFKNTILIGLLPYGGIDIDGLVLDEAFLKPTDLYLLMKRIKTLIG